MIFDCRSARERDCRTIVFRVRGPDDFIYTCTSWRVRGHTMVVVPNRGVNIEVSVVAGKERDKATALIIILLRSLNARDSQFPSDSGYIISRSYFVVSVIYIYI